MDDADPSAMVVDGAGASVVIGILRGGADFGGGTLTSAGGSDIYLVKYSATGGYLWSRRFGGTSNEVPKSVAVDAGDNVIITGYFGGTVDFGGGPLTGSSTTGFVAKYSPTGAHLWSRRLSTGTVLDMGTAVGTDGAGNVLLAGRFAGTVNFGGGPLTAVGGMDIVLLKYNSVGGLLWSLRIGGAGDEMVQDLAVDQVTGQFVTAGFFTGSVDFGRGAVASAGANDAFVAKYSSTGAPVWSQTWGSTSEDKANSVALDRLGNVAVTGMFTNNVDFGGGPISNQGGAGSGDIFLVSLDQSGGHLWSKGFGNSITIDQIGYGVDFDSGDVVLTGLMVALNFPYTVDFGGGPLTGDGYGNNFIARFHPDGTHVWSKRWLGNNAHNLGRAVGTDNAGNIIATGYFNNTVNFGGATLSSPGGIDTYLVKLQP